MSGLSGLVERTPLRVKLMATVLLLAALGLSAAAVAATAALHSYLVDRVDRQLQVAARGIADGLRFGIGRGGLLPGSPADGEGARLPREGGRLPSPYYVRAFAPDGSPTGNPAAAPLTVQSPPDLPTLRPDDPAVRSGRPFTVSSVDGAGSWRVVAVTVRSGSGTFAVATSLSDVAHTVNRMILVEVLIGAGALALMGGFGFLLIRRSLSSLVAVEHTAAAIAAGDLSQRVPEQHPSTEVGRLAAALNAMLARIEDAFARQRASEQQARASEERMRRFVADASHELRTPLTTVRGFAELHRIGGAGPDDVADSMARIEDEAARMGLLVDDLLVLAWLDQQRPLEQAPVDMLDIAHDIVATARRTEPGRTIDLSAETPVPPIVTGDETRLRQVLDNLMRNALTHTPTEAAINVKVVTEEITGRVIVDVADQGPGMTEDDAAHVFERFYRADPARSRGSGGSGLGLSIVAGLVAAHGGTVSMTTALGEGATFRVELPLAE
jgi:two-component system OmpR family sensor kinase